MTETCLSMSVSCSNSGFSRSYLACPKSLSAFAAIMEFCRGSKSWRLGTYQTSSWRKEKGLGTVIHASISLLVFSNVRFLLYPVLEDLTERVLLGLKSTISSEGVWKIKRRERSSEIEVFKVEECGHGDVLSEEFVTWRNRDMKSTTSPEPPIWKPDVLEIEKGREVCLCDCCSKTFCDASQCQWFSAFWEKKWPWSSWIYTIWMRS